MQRMDTIPTGGFTAASSLFIMKVCNLPCLQSSFFLSFSCYLDLCDICDDSRLVVGHTNLVNMTVRVSKGISYHQ